MTKILEHINSNFSGRLKTKEKRRGVTQLYLPVYHEDGDMVDLFIREENNEEFTLSDYGMTIMRLSYEYEIDTENKERIFNKMLSEHGLKENDGSIEMSTSFETIYQDIMHFTHALAKIGSMQYFKREVIESLFYEQLDEYISTELQSYNPQKDVTPMEGRDEYQVDYEIRPNGTPHYLFAVKDASKARLATISCLEFMRNKLSYRSVVVHEAFENLPKKDQLRLTNACDKQFTSLNEFREHGLEYFSRK
jgi:hypothetical protein